MTLNLKLVIEGDAKGATKAARQTEKEIGKFNKSVDRASGKFNRFGTTAERSMGKVSRSSKQAALGVSTMGRRADVAAGRFLRLARIVAAGFVVREIINYADAWTRVGRSIKSTENIFVVRLRSAGEIAKLAIETRSDLESISILYTRTAAATRELGTSEQDVATITTTLAKALKLGSASTEESNAVLRQFSQALQKGKLDGDEFRSVMENAGIVSKALAQQLNVTKSELLDLAAEGKIRIVDLVGAMKNIAPEVNREFAKAASTTGEAFTNLSTRVNVFIGRVDEATGASEKLANALGFVADAVKAITPDTQFERLKKELVASEKAVKSLQEQFDSIDGSSFFSKFVTTQVKGSLDEAVAKLNRIRNAIAAIGSDNEGLLPSIVSKPSSSSSSLFAGRKIPTPQTRPKNLGPLGFAPPRRTRTKNTAKDVIDNLRFETAQLGLNNTQQEINNALRAAGVGAASAQGREISGLVTSYAAAQTAQEQYDAAVALTGNTLRGVLGDLNSSLRQGAGFWKSLGDAGLNALDRITSKLLDMASDNIMGNAFGGVGSNGGSGIFGGLLSSIFGSGVVPAIGGVPFGGFLASGGPVSKNQAYVVGEKGPELFLPGQSGSIVPNNRVGGGSSTINNSFVVSVNVESSDDGEQDQAFAARIGNTVREKLNGLVDERMQKNSRYGGAFSPRGVPA